MADEEWRAIDGYAGYYEVSNLGRVRNAKTLYVLAASDNGHGYLYVGLHRDGRARSRSVHRLVAIAFIPNPENKREVNHIDTDRKNARADNLEWVDKYENHEHSARMGKYRAATNPNRVKKLNAEAVADCKRRYAEGNSIHSIARHYRVKWSTVQRAMFGRPSQSKRSQEGRLIQKATT